MFNFCSEDVVYRDTVHYWTVYVVIKNQYITFCYKRCFFFNLNPSLTIGGSYGNLITIFGFSNIKITSIILNFNRQRKKFADQCYSFTSSIAIRPIGVKTLR
jgi:hypothetical protein